MFITIGPYHATGSSIGLPETSRKRTALLSRLHDDFVSAIEQHERTVAGLLARDGLHGSVLLREHAEWR